MCNSLDDKTLYYDPTVELQNEWTVLLHREKGKQLLENLKKRICPETEIIVLDFSMVTAIDKSFFDAFLVPLLHDVIDGNTILGINIDQKIIQEDIYKKGIHTTFKNWDIHFFVINKKGIPYLLGTKNEFANDILNLLWTEGDQTIEQMAFKLDLDMKKIENTINYLVDIKLIINKETSSKKYKYYRAEHINKLKTKIGRSIQGVVKEKIIERSIVENGHFELPSGVHISKLYHISRLLEESRLTRIISTHFGNIFGNLDPKYILTVETPNNMILAHRIAQTIGVDTRSIFAKVHPYQKKLILHEGFEIEKEERGLIAVDTVTTGYIINLLINLVKEKNSTLIGICSILDISNGAVFFPLYKYYPLIQESVDIYVIPECPLCKSNIPLYKPKIMPGEWK